MSTADVELPGPSCAITRSNPFRRLSIVSNYSIKSNVVKETPPPKLISSSFSNSPPPNKHDYSFKIITLGKSGVGKTSLSLRYTNNLFTDVSSTLGLDYSWKSIRLGSKNVFLRVWDTSGQERYRQIVQQYVRKSDGVILAYDITDPSSVDEIQWYLNFANTSGAEHACKILVGCKADKAEDREISQEIGHAIAEELGITYVETSAKESYNVEAAFRTLSTEILERRMEIDNYTTENNIKAAKAAGSSIDLHDSSKRRKGDRKWMCF